MNTDAFLREHATVLELRRFGYTCPAEALIATWSRSGETLRQLGVTELGRPYRVPLARKLSAEKVISFEAIRRTDATPDVEFRFEHGSAYGKRLCRALGRIVGCQDWVEVERFDVNG